MRNVMFAAPFPLETTLRFARAVARLHGVRLLGVGHRPPGGADARLFDDFVRVADGLDARQLCDAGRVLERRHGRLHRVLGILEPLQVQLAEVRRALGVPGTGVATADLFRDKARMKDELRRHGLPCARHRLIRSWADAERFAAEVGLPLVLKPPAGMGCKSTWRINSRDELRAALGALHASPERPALAEEFLRGREYSFETLTLGGRVRFQSCTRYFPTPLEVMESPWIKWVVVLPRDIDTPEYADARALGVRAVEALGLDTGMTHMEWFRRDDGSLAIGDRRAPAGREHRARQQLRPRRRLLPRLGARRRRRRLRRPVRAQVRGRGRVPARRRPRPGRADHRRRARQPARRPPRRRVPPAAARHAAPDSYEGDGYVIVRDPDTDVVKAAMTAVIENVQIEYA